MEIKSAFKTYHVSVNDNFDKLEAINVDKDSYIVIDKNVYNLYGDKFFSNISKANMYILDSTEENKVVDTALEICERMTAIPAKRNLKYISVGGGIVQDVSGFVANILYRGVHWTFFPTTLLASCDSCIGGKTSLNYKKYKNLLGTFYPPDEINICTPFFDTLIEKDFKSGLGEVVKFNVMQGEEGLENLEENISRLLYRDKTTLATFTKSSLKYKKNFIEQDEFDRGERIKLNFAHTFGHAFETVSNYIIPHGTAVAMGTIVANRISLSRSMLESRHVERMENILKQIITIDQSAIDLDIDGIMSAIHKDKKQVGTNITAVLMDESGDLKIVHDVKQAEIEEAVNFMLSIID